LRPQPDFLAHRGALLSRLAEDEAVLLFGGPHPLRNGDAEYRYRPQSDVWWLTGWPDPEVAVFLRPGDAPLTIFCQKKDREREVWTGFRPGPEGALADYGASEAFEFSQLEAELPRLLQGVEKLHFAFAQDAEHDALLALSISKAARAARRSGVSVPDTFIHPSKLIHELRLHKTAEEIAVMREAARITALAHEGAVRATRPGAWEHEIEALVNYTFRRHGGDGPGYTSIVAGGKNACILHYIENNRQLIDGELLLLDAGCEYRYYTADVTRTWPINGRFSAPQRDVYQAVLASQIAAIDLCRVGNTFRDVHDATVRHLSQSMIDLGLLKGSLDEIIETEKYKKYYMHGTSHWLGIDVHDAGTYARQGRSRALTPGIVMTIEPGLYIPADDTDAPEALRGIGVRIEDDIHVTDAGPDNLTAAIPKSIADLEAIIGRD